MGRVSARLCSRNENKLRELRSVLGDWELSLLQAEGFPPEEGTSYYENALAKALFGRAVGEADAWMLGEDSGIEVEALGGRPGIESARWADDGVARLLRELDGVAGRGARYVCELVCISPDGAELRGTGTLEGSVALAPRGSEGFGYDPIFVPDGETRTVAELGNAWKAEHSHRARAGRALCDALAARIPA
jgi:XTP/dITP diphosphohydrolase